MKKNRAAQQLGRRGGRTRARRLSRVQKRGIAALGGRSRGESLKIAKRIEVNFRYLEVINALAPHPRIVSVSNCRGPLPNPHAKTHHTVS